MKIGKFELDDWKWCVTFGCGPDNKTVCGWFREIHYDYVSNMPGCVALYTTDANNNWEVKFWYELDFLNKIYNQKIMVGSEDEVKSLIDSFLVRISGLTAFL